MDPAVIKLLRKARTMTLSTTGIKTWTTKTFYAMDHGFLFYIEKGGLTLKNIAENPNISFAIDENKLNLFVQGSGKVEILGEPDDLQRERGILLHKVPEDAAFSHSGHVYLARLVPDEIRVLDMRVEMKRYSADVKLEEMTEHFHPIFSLFRVWSFQQSIIALIIGSILAVRLNVLFLVLSVLGIMAAHGAFNAISGYFDFRTGNDTPRSLTSSRVFVDNLVHPRKALGVSYLMLALALVDGIYLAVSRPQIWPFILIGVVAGALYSAPKIGFKKYALGDVAVFVAWSPGIFLGAYVLQGGIINIPILLISFSVALLTVNILHGNNWRDMDDDRKVGVRTVANVLGEEGSKLYYYGLIWSPYVLVVLAYFLESHLYPLFAVMLTVPLAIQLSRIASNRKNIKRSMLDMLTARATFYFGLFGVISYLLFTYASGALHIVV